MIISFSTLSIFNPFYLTYLTVRPELVEVRGVGVGLTLVPVGLTVGLGLAIAEGLAITAGTGVGVLVTTGVTVIVAGEGA